MMIYSVTVTVDADRFAEWKKYMLHKHIPDVLATGCFYAHSIWQHVQENPDSTTCTIQYHCASKEVYTKYTQLHAPDLQKEHTEMFHGCFTATRTLLEPIVE